MRILAIVLGVVAIVGSCFTGISYVRAKSGEQRATADKAKAVENLAFANRRADYFLAEEVPDDQFKKKMTAKRLEEEKSFQLAGGEVTTIAVALERIAACERSFNVWLSVETRDQHFAYALLFLWVAFGFALALSRE